jgi:hypothetical protein
MTAAEKVFARFSSMRFPQKALLPTNALAVACTFRDMILQAMKEAGLSPQDCAMSIVIADTNLENRHTLRIECGKEADLCALMVQMPAVTLGVVIAILDREQDKRLLRAFPFVYGDRALQWLSDALDEQEMPSLAN